MSKIQGVQNAAARVIFMKSKYWHFTPLLKELHWLPVTYRIQFKVILITARYGTLEHIQLFARQNTKCSLRSNNAILLTPPLKKIRGDNE